MTASITPRRILLIRPSALGDVCRSVCVPAALHRNWPEARIDWVVQDDFVIAVDNHPAVTTVIPFPRKRLAKWWRNPARCIELVKWFAELRRNRYDLVLDCQGLGRSGLMTLLTGAKVRTGLRAAREFAWLGYNRRIPRDRNTALPPHTVDQMMSLVEGLGIDSQRDMRLYLADESRRWWKQKRHELNLSEGPYAVLAPTSRWPSKRWPIERFTQLIEPLAKRGFAGAVVIGAPGEQEQVRALFDKPTRFVIDLVGKATIAQTMAVIAESGLVIANDSAPLHMAVGFDRPCVGLFGPTDPALVGPYRRDDAVIRGYHASSSERINFKDAKLGDSLMRFISTAAVIQKIDAALAIHTPSANKAAFGSESGDQDHRECAKSQAAVRADS